MQLSIARECASTKNSLLIEREFSMGILLDCVEQISAVDSTDAQQPAGEGLTT